MVSDLVGPVVAGLSVMAAFLTVAADSVMDDVQAETAAAFLDLGDRSAEEVRPATHDRQGSGLVAAAARGPATER